MKNLSLLVLAALCLGSLGCEMHPASQRAHDADETPTASGEAQKPAPPESVNPAPPSYFPTPKSG